MSTIVFPYTLTPDTTADATQVQSNFTEIATVVNGNLDANNIATTTPGALTGAVLAAGSSSSLARADHRHTVQSFELLSADPSSGNFVNRMYMNSSTGKVRQCTATAGSGTWVTAGNYGATDLPAHAAQHVAGGDDLLGGPICQLTKNGTVGISASTLTAVLWAVEVVDNDSMHSTVSNTSRITFTHAGLYDIKVALAWDTLSSSGSRFAWVQLNGAGTVLVGSVASGTGNDPTVHNMAVDYIATAADYIEVFVYQTSGGTLNLLGSNQSMTLGTRTAPCQFSARWVGKGS